MNSPAVTAMFSRAGASARESARAAMGTATKAPMSCRWPKRSGLCRWRCSNVFEVTISQGEILRHFHFPFSILDLAVAIADPVVPAMATDKSKMENEKLNVNYEC